MIALNPKHLHILAITLSSGLLTLGSNAATIVQTTNASSDASFPNWNTAALWGGSAPTAGNDYVTTAGFVASTGTGLGTGSNITGRVRDNGSTFAGDSFSISSGTELLLKQSGGQATTGNVTMNGGIIRLSPNAAGSALLTGTLNVISPSVIGVNQNASTTLTISSTITGSANLRIAAGGLANDNGVNFNGNLSGFSGDMIIGGGDRPITLSLAQNYTLPNLDLLFGGFSTADRLNLTNNISIANFFFNGNPLPSGTYTATDLNTSFGNGSQFLGSGTLTVIPEPASTLLCALGAITLFGRRRRH